MASRPYCDSENLSNEVLQLRKILGQRRTFLYSDQQPLQISSRMRATSENEWSKK